MLNMKENKHIKKNLPSNKKFGSLFALVFGLLFAHSFVKYGLTFIAGVHLAVAAFFLLGGLFDLKILTPLNAAWFSIGELLGKVVSPIVLGVIFFVLITPVAVVSRLLGRDELRLHRPQAATYWRSTAQSRIDPGSFKNQF